MVLGFLCPSVGADAHIGPYRNRIVIVEADRVVRPYGGSIELLPFIGRADVGIAPYERFIVPLAFSGRRGEGTLEMVIKPLR